MKKLLTISLFLTIWMHGELFCQADHMDIRSGTKWSVFWNGTLDFKSDNFERSQFTMVGFGTNVRYIFPSGIGIEARFSYRHWRGYNQRTVVPLMIGLNYTISASDKTSFLIRSGIGPEGVIGNDYSSFFAGFEIGPELQIKIGSKHFLNFGTAFAQGMSFHPDHFEYLDIYAGFQF